MLDVYFRLMAPPPPAATAGAANSKKLLTVADVGTGFTGAAYWYAAGEPVGPVTLTQLADAHKDVKTVSISDPNNAGVAAGNMPKERSLVAVEKTASVRARQPGLTNDKAAAPYRETLVATAAERKFHEEASLPEAE